MSKFNELYGYLSDRQTPHLFVIAEVLYGVKESIDKHNEHLASIAASLEKLAGKPGSGLAPGADSPPTE